MPNRLSYQKADALVFSESKSNLRAALAFLEAYWKANLPAALAWCSPQASIELARSLPIRTPARVDVVLPLMIREVYSRFENQRFDTRIVGTHAARDRVLVEYVACGKLTTGGPFECGYAVVFDFLDGAIENIRVYAEYGSAGIESAFH